MKPWHQVVVLHPDIRAGKFDELVFAADDEGTCSLGKELIVSGQICKKGEGRR